MLQGLGQGQPTEPAEPTWESAEARLEKEEKALWNAEYEIRLRCDGLPQLEATELTNGDLWEGDQQCLHDVDKLMKFYGAASGGNASCKRLLKWMNEKHPVRAGTTSTWYSAQFTLGKHLLLSERQSMQEEIPENTIACKCFAATYVVVSGCCHQKVPPHKTPVLYQTLCPTCSTCLRCDKLPAYKASVPLMG